MQLQKIPNNNVQLVTKVFQAIIKSKPVGRFY